VSDTPTSHATPVSALPLHLDTPPVLVHVSAHADHGRDSRERYHTDFWSLNLYVQAAGELRIDGGPPIAVRSGMASLTPPRTDFSYAFAGHTVMAWVHFRDEDRGAATHIPPVVDLGAGFRLAVAQAERIQAMHAAGSPRARAVLWDLLWSLAEKTRAAATEQPHRGCLAAMAYVNRHLARELDRADIAAQAGLSPVHLNRLFLRHAGLTVSAYVRRCRMEMACHLLETSDLPIKVVALQCGIPDLQQFNKLVRRHTGSPPSRVRTARAIPPPQPRP
jgi:AraC-like DNA-binding protein